MCKICDDWNSNKIDSVEAFKRIRKATKDKSKETHLMELSDKILDSEVPFTEPDRELDKLWEEEE